MIKTITEDILTVLNSTGYNIIAYSASLDELDCIVYSLIPQTADCAKEEYRLEITVIARDFVTAMNMLDTVKKAIITTGDMQLTEHILSVEQTGGGTIYNYGTNTHHMKAFFTLRTKEVKL